MMTHSFSFRSLESFRSKIVTLLIDFLANNALLFECPLTQLEVDLIFLSNSKLSLCSVSSVYAQ